MGSGTGVSLSDPTQLDGIFHPLELALKINLRLKKQIKVIVAETYATYGVKVKDECY